MKKLIELLHHQNLVWHGAQQFTSLGVESSGYHELDQQLNGGFQQGVTEIQSDTGIGELRLLMPLLTNAFAQERLVVFVAPLGIVSPQALLANGFKLDKVLLIHPESHQDALWAAEQCLRSGACHSVVMWLHAGLEVHQVKRLQVASKQGNCYQFILRVNKAESLSLPFDLSLSLEPSARGLTARINKRKGGWKSESFFIDMSARWPSLVLPNQVDNVVPFPHKHVG